jgi:uncharacterized protein (DUF4415 family)
VPALFAEPPTTREGRALDARRVIVYKCAQASRRWNTNGTGETTVKKEYDFSKGKRGPVVPPEPGKTRITIRLDNDVIEHFQETVDRAGGGNYQTLMNRALREYILGSRLETVVREAVRKEFKAAAEKPSRRSHVQRIAASG